MAENIEEQDTATEEEEQFLRKYAFDCEGCGAVSTGSPELIVPPPGIQVIFIRYALIKEDNSTHPFVWPPQKDPTRMAPEGAPAINGYKYVRTSLRPEGWVYIFKESTQKFERIDIHHLSLRFQYTLKKGETIWAAYSEITWSDDYHNSLISDCEKRETRMQKIAFDDWYYQQTHPDGCDIDQVDAVFDTHLESYIFQDKHINVLANEDDPDRKEYMFMCLHDPLAIADQLTEGLNLRWYEMEALLLSLQTGLEKSKILEAILQGKMPEEIAKMQEEDTLTQVDALFKIAVLLKHGVIKHDQSEGPEIRQIPMQHGGSLREERKQLADYLDKDRVRKLLATEERTEIKKKIKIAKDCLATFVDSSYYQENLVDYKDNYDEYAALGKCRISLHCGLLRHRVNEKDKFIDTREENEKWEKLKDPGREYVQRTTLYHNIAGQLLKRETIIDLIDLENTAKVIGLYNGLLANYVDYTDHQLSKTTDSYSILSSIKVRLDDDCVITLFDEDYLPSILKNPPRIEDGAKILNLDLEKIETKAYMYGAGVEIRQIRLTTEFEQELQRPKSLLYKFANNLQYSEKWNRFMAGVAYVNLGLATIGLGKAISNGGG